MPQVVMMVSPHSKSYCVTFTELNYNFIRHVYPKQVKTASRRQSSQDCIKVRLNKLFSFKFFHANISDIYICNLYCGPNKQHVQLIRHFLSTMANT
jgi:hypothetical protein